MNTDVFVYLSRFLYQIRYKVVFSAIFVTTLSIYLTGYLPKTYTVRATIFTGIVSGSNIDSEATMSWYETNTAFDNIINLIKSRKTLQQVSMRLLAQDLVHGKENEDTEYITADNYRKLIKQTEEIAPLVDKKSEKNTLANLESHWEESPQNFLYKFFNGTNPHYSFEALSEISIKRQGNSDMLEIVYTSDDPGIAYCTQIFMIEELKRSYENIRFGASSNVIQYFDDQIKNVERKLKKQEDSLMKYSEQNQIVNYEEQTKHLAALSNDYENRYQNILLDYNSSSKLLTELEKQMNTQSKLLKENEDFVSTLDNIATLNSQITELEAFSSKGDSLRTSKLNELKANLKKEEQRINAISTQMNIYKYSKEGVKIDEMVQQWLNALILNEKSGAELKTMERMRSVIDEEMTRFSPIGPDLKRREREVKITEESYLELLHGLSQARLRQKNIEMSSSSLEVITPPSYPIFSNSSKRGLYIIASFFGSIIFVIGFYFLLELIDRTIHNARRAKAFTQGNVLGAFPGKGLLKYRGFERECQRKAIAYACNALRTEMHKDQTTCINLLSIEAGEGKSYISNIMQEQWSNFSFHAKAISYHKDFNVDSPEFIEAKSVFDLYTTETTDSLEILITEFPNLHQIIPTTALLQNASVNILIIDANRAWKEPDQHIFNRLKKLTGNTPLFVYLNKTERYAVEEFTGQLPPYTRKRKLIYNIFNFQFTGQE